MKAVDTATNTSNAIECFVSKGVTAVGRYYADPKNAWKIMSKVEAQALAKAGITLWAVYQDGNTKYAHFSADKGRKQAQTAIDYARTVIGQPTGSAIYFTVDYNATAAEADGKIRDYFAAVAAELGAAGFKLGVYGNGVVCARMLDDKLTEHTWLSGSSSYHGTKKFYKSKRWSLCQSPQTTFCGINIDPNEICESGDFGGFRLGAQLSSTSAAKPDQHTKPLPVKAAERCPTCGSALSKSVQPAPLETSSRAFVSTDGLKLRDKPDGAEIDEFNLGDEIELLGISTNSEWRHVRTAAGKEGHAFAYYLRPPQHPTIEALLRCVRDEWLRFNKGAAREESDPYCGYVGEMWRAIGLNYDGRSKYPDGRDVPWSAAFICFVVRNSGPQYVKFAFKEGHAHFVHDAIQARIVGRADRPFWGYRHGEQRPQLGDIVARNRGSNNFSYDFAENHSQYESHSDVVVEVREKMIRVMGGNVGDTVSLRSFSGGDNLQEYDLDANGFIAPGQRVIALLKNRTADM